jgi:branched-chain amino acid transport system permease protein
LILGILLIILMFFMPGGIVAGVRKIKGRVLTVTPAAPLELGGPTSVGDSDATNVTDDTPVGAEQPGDSAGDDTADEVPTT